MKTVGCRDRSPVPSQKSTFTASRLLPKNTNSAPLRGLRPMRSSTIPASQSKPHRRSIGWRPTNISTPWGIVRALLPSSERRSAPSQEWRDRHREKRRLGAQRAR